MKGVFYGIAAILSALATALCWWRHAGPYRWVADLQQSLLGVNLLQISLLLCWAGLYLPLHFVAQRFDRRFGGKGDPLAWKRLVALWSFFNEGRGGQVAIAGLTIFGVGAWMLISAASSGPLTTLSVASAEAGERPKSRHVHLEDAKVIFNVPLTYTRDHSVEHYYPVISEKDATEPDQLMVFVRLDGKDDRDPPPHDIVGELELDGLPGALRAPLEDKKLLAPGYFVVRHGWNPEEQIPFRLGLCGVGALVFSGGLFWARRNRRRQG
jgi:hypothetical protein